MTLFIDSAVYSEVQQALSWSWVGGVTTNPSLLAKAGSPPLEALRKITALMPQRLFYQLTGKSVPEMISEADEAKGIAGDSLVIKIAPTAEGFEVASKISSLYPVCITAVFSAAQAIVARETGAAFIAFYVNRATRLLGDALPVLHDIAAVLKGSSTEILAASIKSPEEAASSIIAGAHHLTIGFEVLKSMTANEHSESVIRDFDTNGVGINPSPHHLF